MRALGGIAPFGYRWQHGKLVIDENEAPVRKLIYELFLKHRRKKTVAKLLNELGYRTRNASLFSDTTIDRLLRDTTARGIRIVGGKEIQVEPIIAGEIWQRVNDMLGEPKPAKQALEIFSGIVFCDCGGKMVIPSNSPKYVCIDCRHKILKDDLETIFQSQLKEFGEGQPENLYESWEFLTKKEKRILIEQICERIVIASRSIHIRFAFGFPPHPFKAVADEQQNARANESHENLALLAEPRPFKEPLLSESEAARFLGISKMTVLRKRNAGELGFFRVGFRILYSKENHLIPYLRKCEN